MPAQSDKAKLFRYLNLLSDINAVTDTLIMTGAELQASALPLLEREMARVAGQLIWALNHRQPPEREQLVLVTDFQAEDEEEEDEEEEEDGTDDIEC